MQQVSDEVLHGSLNLTAATESSIEHITWHCLRHRFASRLVMAGVDLRTVAELLGHRTLQMVMRYSHLAPEHQVDAVDRLVPAAGNRNDHQNDHPSFGSKTRIQEESVNAM